MPDYQLEQGKCEDFLKNFQSEYDFESKAKYMEILQDIANRASRVLEIDLNDLLSYQNDEELVESVLINTKRYIGLFAAAADTLMPTATALQGGEDTYDLLSQQRRNFLNAPSRDSQGTEMPVLGTLPPGLSRRFEVIFLPLIKDKPLPLRQVGAKHVGKLVTLQGVVVRCTDVKPMCTVATYTCSKCGHESYQEILGREFTPLTQCTNSEGAEQCKGQPTLATRLSKFVKFQEVKMQEPAGDVPQGSVPRTLTVHIKGELTRTVKPGEMVTLSGIYLPVPFTGYKAMRAGLLTQTYLEAMQVLKDKQSYADVANNPVDRQAAEELAVNSQDHGENGMYEKLAASIAPEIFGHEDVKKILLLMMVGGVTKTTSDGMRLRGDIHVLLMGDPGVAKSQLLKQVATISPRSVYTTGKGSSGVGLTAAVMRDPTTGEMVLEGGALVLADKGVCCIDEFDKMEEQDRTAIHEAMEQQTVSIAKGGITTTLNTRATVLAAANPAGGSYDVSRTPAQNINLPPALLSRFDFLWLLLDKPNEEVDLSLAQHVLRVHRTRNHLGKDAAEMETYLNHRSDDDPLPTSVVRAYIGMVREYNPVVPEALASDIAQIYADMRASAAKDDVITARQLLAMLRMSQALARLRMSDSIGKVDLEEAQRLLTMSKASLASDKETERTDTISAIYSRIAKHLVRRKEALKEAGITRLLFEDIRKIVRNANFPCSDQQIQQTLVEYSQLNVWTIEGSDIILDAGDLEDERLSFPNTIQKTMDKEERDAARKKQKKADKKRQAAMRRREAEQEAQRAAAETLTAGAGPSSE